MAVAGSCFRAGLAREPGSAGEGRAGRWRTAADRCHDRLARSSYKPRHRARYLDGSPSGAEASSSDKVALERVEPDRDGRTVLHGRVGMRPGKLGPLRLAQQYVGGDTEMFVQRTGHRHRDGPLAGQNL